MAILKEFIRTIFYIAEPEIRDRAENENLDIMQTASLLFAAAEALAVCIFCLAGNGHYVKSFSITQATIGFLINIIYYFCSKAINYKADKSVTKKIYQGAYFVSLLLWSLNISIYHYRIGEQVTTLYLVLVGITCFVTLAPRFAIPLISLPIIFFYWTAYSYDGARRLITLNYFSLGAMFIAGSYIRYRLKLKSLKQMVELERINIVLDREAREDQMTGLRNRLCLSDDYESFQGHRLCVIMLDIDYFKLYNDTYGHLVGDRVLKEIANVMIETFSRESCYRYGGDEFMAVIKEPREEYIREKLSEWNDRLKLIAIENVSHRLTCSYGYAISEVHSTEDFLRLQKLADERLYENKKHRPEWE